MRPLFALVDKVGQLVRDVVLEAAGHAARRIGLTLVRICVVFAVDILDAGIEGEGLRTALLFRYGEPLDLRGWLLFLVLHGYLVRMHELFSALGQFLQLPESALTG